MIMLFAGEKGTGKTKKLIDMANDALCTTDGHIVFIASDTRSSSNINLNIRVVDMSEYYEQISTCRELVGFVYGMLSQNSDISEIYIDSVSHIVNGLANNDIAALVKELKRINAMFDVRFIISINADPGTLPEVAKEYVA